ncbi:hypothetical protein FRB94_006804 [Tulasnella sp. JGI-2019a]|nr:hypothetical protein FRB93_010382 [Tulasnella sp. JGI-2019a]KAG9012004.1 hypothetical protein FRB94_006804 [Tulasnella sp. JGI-2019a]
MRSSFSTFFALLFFASLSAAHIVGISAPASVKAGKAFNVVFQTESHIINDSDEYAIIGAFQGTSACNGCLGMPIGFFDLHPSHENTGHGSFTESVSIPKAGTYTLTAVITSIVGVGHPIKGLRSL